MHKVATRALPRFRRLFTMAHEAKRLKIGDDRAVATKVDADSLGMSTEQDVGITEYISDHAGFFGILKQRFTDFLVNEIDLGGNVVHLTSLSVPPQAQAADSAPADAQVAEADTSAAMASLVAALGESVASDISALAASRDPKRELTVPFPGDKSARTRLHEAFRACYPNLTTDTVDGPTSEQKLVRIRLGRDERGNRRGRREYKGPDYTAFVLYKENRDTLAAINLLASMMKTGSKIFSYAGTKDRRGVTVQNVAAYRVPAERLAGLNRRLMGIRLGNFRSATEPMRLGELRGNRFVISIRNVTCDAATADAACRSLSERGFVNYYGLQRFGTSSIPTHAIGRALLRGDYEKAVDLILWPRDNDPPEQSEARRLWTEKRDAAGAMAQLPKHLDFERRLLHALATRAKTDYLGALKSALPRNLRLIYIHSYQSYVWNCMASERIRRFGLAGPVAGDVVVAQPGASVQESAAEDVAEIPAGDVPADAAEGGAAADAGASGNGSSDRRGTSDANVRVLTADEAASGRWTIDDVLLPLPGYDVVYPSHELAQLYQDRMREDDVDLSDASGRGKPREFSLAGGYRPLIARPADFTWRLIPYTDPNETLVKTDLDRLMESQASESRMETDPVPAPAVAQPFVALQFEMSLPSSTYATMAIRELLKSSTVTRYHALLTAAGTAASGEAAAAGSEAAARSDQ